jgi:hypothetical protein
MAFRLVSYGGQVGDVSMVNVRASGTIKPGCPVDLAFTSGLIASPSSSTSTGTMAFGVAHDYAQGASDVEVRITPFDYSQLWEVDCTNAATTAQIGIRHALSAVATGPGYIHNTSTDQANYGIFLALAMTGSTTGSGKLIGKIVSRIRSYSGGLG